MGGKAKIMKIEEVKIRDGGILNGLSSIETFLGGLCFSLSLILMFYEVVSRYIFNFSVYWSEELVRYLIIWSMFIGASMIIKTDGHIAISFFVDKLSERRKTIANQLNNLFCLIYSIFLLYTGWLLVNEAYIAKNISDSRMETPMWIPYLILPLGGLLLSVRWIEKIINTKLAPGWHKDVFTYFMLAVGIALAALVFTSSNPLLILLVGMVVLLLAGMPVAFTMGLLGMAVLAAFDLVGFSTIASKQFWSINTFSLLAIPFFIFAGGIISKTAIGIHLVDLMVYLLRKVTGGVAIAVMLVSIIFAAMSGSSVANAAALGMICVPMLEKAGYPRTFAAGILGAGGTLAIIIPPSTILVLYGAVAGASISDLFIAGTVPGVILGLVLCAYIYYRSKKGNYGASEKDAAFSWSEVWSKLKKAGWALVMPVIVLGSIYAGITTPTEAAVIASVYALFVSMFIYRDIKIKDILNIVKDSVELSAMIYTIVMTSALFGFIITIEQVPQKLLEIVLDANIGPIVFLMLINLVVFLMGFFLGPAAIVVMMVPIILPIAKSLGIDLVHLGILMTINMELAFLTPPVGTNLYVLSKIAKLPVAKVVEGVLPFIGILVGALVLITFVPQISLFLIR